MGLRACLQRAGPGASLGLGLALGCASVLALDYVRTRLRRRQGPRGPAAAAEWEETGECWAVRGHADVCELLRSPHVQANYLPSFFARLPPGVPASRFAFLADFFGRWPLFQDGQRQRRTHGVLARLFGSARMHALDAIVHEEVEALLQPLQARGGEFDAVEAFAKPLPLRVIVRALGFSLADAEDFKRWADDIEDWFGGQGDVLERFDTCQRALQSFAARADDLLRTCAARGGGCGEGEAGESRTIAEELVLASERGELEREDVVPNLFFLMSAGHETTASLISNAILLCLDQPEVMRQLRLVVGGRGEARAERGGDGKGDMERGSELDDFTTEMLRIVSPGTSASLPPSTHTPPSPLPSSVPHATYIPPAPPSPHPPPPPLLASTNTRTLTLHVLTHHLSRFHPFIPPTHSLSLHACMDRDLDSNTGLPPSRCRLYI